MTTPDRRTSGFKDRTRLDAAVDRLLAAVKPHDRTERLPLNMADGRAVATTITAPNPVPGYDRAAMDGFAVRAADTFGAGERSPSVLETVPPEDEIVPGTAIPVDTGSELPAGADAVVMIEQVETNGEEIHVHQAVAEGENVGDAGEDVAEGETLYEPGHRLRPSDLGLLKSVGLWKLDVFKKPTVGVVPTGEELVEADPDPGEIIETNGLTVAQYVTRWGGEATYRDIVTDDESALRAAIQRDLTKDIIVTTGGSSVGERDLIPEIVDDLGELLIHGVAIKPGYPVAIGVVDETPVLMLPGYPVSCLVNAVQLLRPALKKAGHLSIEPVPSRDATLSRKVPSEPGSRTFARVETHDDESGELTATPVRTTGAGVLSSVALADGWVVVPEDREGYAAGDRVAVENWEQKP
ncbi:gephyrin-like molybdotransferase Glp [Halohasta litorea]|uniref:Gephyrin-like molybdotransferase Glp n=1 Tax=Halohasta litorea TaxID=869891 RepID=A0ABD6DA29_9EURY|nr:gephyrin-like molybdotransferase Glp [Halohasta litorea]